jgi:hypothetical protein
MPYQHKGYEIALTATDRGCTAECVSESDQLRLERYASKGDALYAAMRSIDAREIASKIDALLGTIDQDTDPIAKLVHDLVKMIDG